MNRFKIPRVSFPLRVIIFYVVWQQLYKNILVDKLGLLVTNQLEITAGVIKLLGYRYYMMGNIIGVEFSNGIQVVPDCTSFDVFGLFAGFIFLSSASLRSKFTFALLGAGIIYLSNILRLVFIAVLMHYDPISSEFFHDVVASWFFNILNIAMWFYFGKKCGFDVYR